jgi:hypothetical protein
VAGDKGSGSTKERPLMWSAEKLDMTAERINSLSSMP